MAVLPDFGEDRCGAEVSQLLIKCLSPVVRIPVITQQPMVGAEFTRHKLLGMCSNCMKEDWKTIYKA